MEDNEKTKKTKTSFEVGQDVSPIGPKEIGQMVKEDNEELKPKIAARLRREEERQKTGDA